MNELTLQPQQQNSLALNTATSQALIQERIANIQVKLMSAKSFPRDVLACEMKLKQSLKSLELAEKCEFSLPIGGQIQKGASIRLAELLAQFYGNIELNPMEIIGQGRNDDGAYTDVRVGAWDLETNVLVSQIVRVSHVRFSKFGNKEIKDQGELIRIFSQRSASRFRECIFKIIPANLKELALKTARETIVKGDGTALIERSKKVIEAFDKFKITREMLENKVKIKFDSWTGEHIAELISIGNSLKDGESKPSDYFDELKEKETTPQSATVSSVLSELNKKNSEAKK